MIYRTKSPHLGSSFSIVEILVSLYFKALSLESEERDIFILSKGHACSALYAVLAERGLLEKEVLEKFNVDGGLLEGHPSRNLDYRIDVSTGSLGHGLSIGAGMALARKIDGSKSRVFVLLSDGDIQEGSTWQAALFSSHRRLDNLVAVVDYNKLQVLGRVEDVLNLEPLKEKWQAFGWEVREVDGHNFNQLIGGFENFSSGKPTVVIAHTKKGKGVSFMEDNFDWHSKCPDEEEYEKALKELS